MSSGGDCSLANTLFSRDGQLLAAWLVDAETSEVHPILSRGQRRHDLEILVENVAEGLVDLAERLGRPEEMHSTLIAEAEQVLLRYETLWEVLHAEPVFGFSDRYRVEGTIRRLNQLGAVRLQRQFADGEARLSGAAVPGGRARRRRADRRPAVGHRGVDTVRAVGARSGTPHRHAHPGLLRSARGALATQREGRSRRRHQPSAWALARDVIPTDSAAKMAVTEIPTAPFAVLQSDDDS